MKSRLNSDVTKALLVFAFFVLMSVLTMAREWERTSFKEEEIYKLKKELFLNVSQEKQIAILHRNFYDELAKVYATRYSNPEEFCQLVSKIVGEYNFKVTQALNAEQRKKWQSMMICQ